MTKTIIVTTNDIIVIPSAKTRKITFAYAGEYYEEVKDFDDEDELVISDTNINL